MAEPSEPSINAALIRSLTDAAVNLGRCTAAVEALRTEFTELHNFVNEQLSVNYQDLAARISKLELGATARRASWKTITGIAAAVAGGSGLITVAIDWVRHLH